MLSKDGAFAVWTAMICRFTIIVLLWFNLKNPEQPIDFGDLMLTFFFGLIVGSVNGYLMRSAKKNSTPL